MVVSTRGIAVAIPWASGYGAPLHDKWLGIGKSKIYLSVTIPTYVPSIVTLSPAPSSHSNATRPLSNCLSIFLIDVDILAICSLVSESSYHSLQLLSCFCLRYAKLFNLNGENAIIVVLSVGPNTRTFHHQSVLIDIDALGASESMPL